MAKWRKKKPKYGSEEAAFVGAINSATRADEDLARRAYADWLAEHDRPIEAAEQRAYAGDLGMYYRLYHTPTGLWVGDTYSTLVGLRRRAPIPDDPGDVVKVAFWDLEGPDIVHALRENEDRDRDFLPHRRLLPWVAPLLPGREWCARPYRYTDGAEFHGGDLTFLLPVAEIEVVVLALRAVKVGVESLESAMTRKQVDPDRSAETWTPWPADAYTQPPVAT